MWSSVWWGKERSGRVAKLRRGHKRILLTRWQGLYRHEAFRNRIAAFICWGFSARYATSSKPPQAPAMATRSQESKTRGSVRPGPSLNVAIDDLAGEASSAPPPAKPVFVSVSALLTVIRVRSLLFCSGRAHTNVSLGLHGQRRGLRQSRTALRRYLQST